MSGQDNTPKRTLEQVDKSPTGETPPAAKLKLVHDNFTVNLVAALQDERVCEALRDILLRPLQQKLKAKDEQITELTAQVDSLKHDVSSLKDAVDELEQYGRRNALRIWSNSMPERPDEDTDQLVLAYAKQVGVDLPAEAIGRSHRVGRPAKGKPRPIIVKLTSYNMRRRLYNARKGCDDYFVSEDLTRLRSNILYKARLERKHGRFKHCWSTDGRINIRLADDTRHSITTLAELDDLIDDTPMPDTVV